MTASVDDFETWAREAALAADDKLAHDTVIIDVGDIFGVSDYFVITSGANTRQVHAIVDEVEHRIRDAGGPSPLRIEGGQEREWVLMDYGAFVVHVFAQTQRDFYQLERLWGDCRRVEWHPVPRREIS